MCAAVYELCERIAPGFVQDVASSADARTIVNAIVSLVAMPLVLPPTVIGFYLLARAFVNADPKSLARGVRYTTIGVTVIVVVFLAVTGRLGAAMAVGAFVVPLVLRWRSVPATPAVTKWASATTSNPPISKLSQDKNGRSQDRPFLFEPPQ